MGPLGQAIEDRVQRLMFSRRRGSHDTLIALSTRMGRILDMDALMHALVHGVLRGVPLTHCALLLEAEGRHFAVALEEAAIEQAPKASPVRSHSSTRLFPRTGVAFCALSSGGRRRAGAR